jgi:hypothetical protein
MAVVVSVGAGHPATGMWAGPLVRGLHVSFVPFELPNRKPNPAGLQASIR